MSLTQLMTCSTLSSSQRYWNLDKVLTSWRRCSNIEWPLMSASLWTVLSSCVFLYIPGKSAIQWDVLLGHPEAIPGALRGPATKLWVCRPVLSTSKQHGVPHTECWWCYHSTLRWLVLKTFIQPVLLIYYWISSNNILVFGLYWYSACIGIWLVLVFGLYQVCAGIWFVVVFSLHWYWACIGIGFALVLSMCWYWVCIGIGFALVLGLYWYWVCILC